MSVKTESTQVLIIGAGPSGSVAAALLRQQGRQVLVLERETFPRFSIGESLLPHSMTYIEAAGLLRDVIEAGFQYKNGAAFEWAGHHAEFDFRDKFSPGWGTTYQVQRAHFDQVLIRGAERMGAQVRYGHEVLTVEPGDSPRVLARTPEGQEYAVSADFILDASGFARLLPRLLKLETPSELPVRGSIFTHVRDHIPIDSGDFDRNKILITTHPERMDVWFWTIPFSNGCCSLGVVAKPDLLDRYQGSDMERLQTLVAEVPNLRKVFKNAEWNVLPARRITGYSANVTRLCGPGYALLGNAGEFLDPVFSSGVTIAFKSAQLAADCLQRHYNGGVDWEASFAAPLRMGVDTFRRFVNGWYSGGLQRIIHHSDQQPNIRQMICSVLSGYAWDTNNPYVNDPDGRRLRTLEELCSPA